jgi:hypothetical protein
MRDRIKSQMNEWYAYIYMLYSPRRGCFLAELFDFQDFI